MTTTAPLRMARAAAAPARHPPRPSRERPGREGQRPTLVLVPDPSIRSRRRILWMLTVGTVGAIGAALFGVVALHVLLAEGQEHVTQLERQLEEAQEAQQLLRTDVARLESPAVVVAAARDSLGMVEPDEVTALRPVRPAPELIAAVSSDAVSSDAGRLGESAVAVGDSSGTAEGRPAPGSSLP